jgi:hypothetical protein
LSKRCFLPADHFTKSVQISSFSKTRICNLFMIHFFVATCCSNFHLNYYYLGVVGHSEQWSSISFTGFGRSYPPPPPPVVRSNSSEVGEGEDMNCLSGLPTAVKVWMLFLATESDCTDTMMIPLVISKEEKEANSLHVSY